MPRHFFKSQSHLEVVLVIILAIINSLNIYLNATGVQTRLYCLALSTFITIIHPHLALYLIALSTLWWEVPNLILKQPNQFLIEPIALGFLIGTTIRQYRKKSSQCPPLSTFSPFHGYMIFVVSATFVTMVTTYSFLLKLHPETSFLAYTLRTVTNLHKWDLQSNFFHGATLANGYLIILLFTKRVVQLAEVSTSFQRNFSLLMTVSILPIFIFGLLQYLYPFDYYSIYTVEYGGFLQNGNHLSFAAASSLFLIIYLGRRFRIPYFLSGLLAISSFIALIFGRGRTSWVAFTVSIIFLGLLNYKIIKRLASKPVIISLLPLSIILFAAIITALPNQFGADFTSILSYISHKDFMSVFGVGDRAQIIDNVLANMGTHWIAGYGPGSFLPYTDGSFDIHNAYLKTFWEFGVLGLIAGILSFFHFFTFQRQKTNQSNRSLTLSFTVFLLLTFLLDVPLSYRSLLLFTLLVFITISTNESRSGRPIYKLIKSNIFFIILGLSAGLATMFYPHILKDPYRITHKIEYDQEKNSFWWVGMKKEFSFERDSCLKLDLKTPLPGGNVISISPTQNPQKNIQIELMDTWTSYCVCQSVDKKIGHITVEAKRGAIYSLITDVPDDRFISFGFRNQYSFPKIKLEENCLKRGNLAIDHNPKMIQL